MMGCPNACIFFIYQTNDSSSLFFGKTLGLTILHDYVIPYKMIFLVT